MEESTKIGMAPMDMGDSRGWEEMGMNCILSPTHVGTLGVACVVAVPMLPDTTCVPTFIATQVHDSAARVDFLVRGGILPFIPCPLGIVEVARAVMFGIFFFLLTTIINSSNFPLLSAIATE